MNSQQFLVLVIVGAATLLIIWLGFQIIDLIIRSRRYIKEKQLWDTGAPQLLMQIWMLQSGVRFAGTTVTDILPRSLQLEILGDSHKLTYEGLIFGHKICGEPVCVLFTHQNVLSGVVDRQKVVDTLRQSYDMLMRTGHRLWTDTFPITFDITVKNHVT
ncbi:MAG: hypothetical protein V4509_00085 [Patescibacteria group bacterium]